LRVVDRRPLYSVPTRLQHILLNRIQQERQHQLRRLSKQMPSTVTQTLLHKPLRKRIYHLRPIPPRHTFEIAKFVIPVHRVKGHLLPIEGSQLRHLTQQHITRPLRVTKIQRPEQRLQLARRILPNLTLRRPQPVRISYRYRHRSPPTYQPQPSPDAPAPSPRVAYRPTHVQSATDSTQAALNQPQSQQATE